MRAQIVIRTAFGLNEINIQSERTQPQKRKTSKRFFSLLLSYQDAYRIQHIITVHIDYRFFFRYFNKISAPTLNTSVHAVQNATIIAAPKPTAQFFSISTAPKTVPAPSVRQHSSRNRAAPTAHGGPPSPNPQSGLRLGGSLDIVDAAGGQRGAGVRARGRDPGGLRVHPSLLPCDPLRGALPPAAAGARGRSVRADLPTRASLPGGRCGTDAPVRRRGARRRAVLARSPASRSPYPTRRSRLRGPRPRLRHLPRRLRNGLRRRSPPVRTWNARRVRLAVDGRVPRPQVPAVQGGFTGRRVVGRLVGKVVYVRELLGCSSPAQSLDVALQPDGWAGMAWWWSGAVPL